MIAEIRWAVAIGLCVATLPVHAQIAKCVDPKTGAITYSNTGCAASDQATTIRRDAPVLPRPDELVRMTGTPPTVQASSESPALTSGAIAQAGRNNENSIECAAAKRQLAVRKSHVTKFASDAKRTDIDVDGACGYPRRPAPPVQSVKSVTPPQLVNCSPGGCWDTRGQWYTRSADVLIRPNGAGVCTQAGPEWFCP